LHFKIDSEVHCTVNKGQGNALACPSHRAAHGTDRVAPLIHPLWFDPWQPCVRRCLEGITRLWVANMARLLTIHTRGAISGVQSLRCSR